MKQYIGSKIVNAVPEYRCHRPGHLFQYVSVGDIVPAGWDAEDGYRIEYEDGYKSWCPKEVFEAAYRETTGMSFGLALEAVKKGLRVARAGWNGKGMYVFLANGVEFFTEADISEFDDQDVEVSDLLVLRTAQETFQPGWLATQSDMLADDWYIVE